MKKVTLFAPRSSVLLTATAPAMAASALEEIGASARSLVSGVVDTGASTVDVLTDRLSDSVPAISDWISTIAAFLETYFGDLFSWLS